MPSSPKRLVLIDDSQRVARDLKAAVEQANKGWEVEPITERSDWEAYPETLKQLSVAQLPALISVDLGLPPQTGTTRVGRKLIEDIRAIDPDVPLCAHSGHALSASEVADIIGNKASFLKLKDDDHFAWFGRLVIVMAEGYVICCGTTTNRLREAIRPNNPLNAVQLLIAEAIARDETAEDIGKRLGIGTARTVQTKIEQIHATLLRAGLIDEPSVSLTESSNRYRATITKWYWAYERFHRKS